MILVVGIAYSVSGKENAFLGLKEILIKLYTHSLWLPIEVAEEIKLLL